MSLRPWRLRFASVGCLVIYLGLVLKCWRLACSVTWIAIQIQLAAWPPGLG